MHNIEKGIILPVKSAEDKDTHFNESAKFSPDSATGAVWKRERSAANDAEIIALLVMNLKEDSREESYTEEALPKVYTEDKYETEDEH